MKNSNDTIGNRTRDLPMVWLIDELNNVQGAGDPGSGTVYVVDLRPLVCWDCGFKPRRGHGCLSVVSVVCCQVEVSGTGRTLIQKESYRLWCV